MSAPRCLNCDSGLGPGDRYCPACGQGVRDGQDRSFAHLLRSSLAEIGSIDSRLWRSLRRLLLRPGFLSLEYRNGRRRQYLSPISLFLLGNLLFFLAPPLSDFQLSLAEQYELQPYRAWIAPWIDGYLSRPGQTFAEAADAYQLRVAELAKLMVIVHVPLLALGTMLMAADKRLFYTDHVIMGLHYFAFLMIYLISMSAVLSLAFAILPRDFPAVPNLAPLVVALQFAYVPAMLRNALGFSWWRAVASLPLFIILLAASHFVYRLLQFLVAFALISVA